MKLTFEKITLGLNSKKSKNLTVDKEIKTTLQKYGDYYKRAVKKGEVFVAKSTKTYGGSPLPWE